MFTSAVFQTILDYFDVTQPKIKVEPIPETFGPDGGVYRLTNEASGEVHNVFVLRDWEQDEKTGEDIVVRDLSSPVTEYAIIHKIDYKDKNSRGRPRVDIDFIEKPLSHEDHEALVDFFEKGREERAKSDPPIQLKILRRYPPKPKSKTVIVPFAKKTLELI